MYNLSVQAYQNKDFGQFLNLNRKLDSLRPSHPTYTYNLACAFALNGKTDEALSVLRKCVLMNTKIDFESEKDLESLKNSEGYKKLFALKSKWEIPVTSSEKIISLSEKTLHTEGLLYLNSSKTWLATSIRNRKIVSFDIHSGQCTDWLSGEDLLSVFAIKADKKEKILWITTSAMPEMKGYNKNFEGKSEILKIDIKTKKILKRFPLQGNHVLGDLVVAKNGDVYISDSGEAVIFKITDDSMSVWLDLNKEAFNLQGLTFDETESQLFIADYLKGILRIPMQDLTYRNWLNFPSNVTVKGIDGLLWHKKTLIAIHNGVKPIRIMQYVLNQNNEITNFNVLDNNRLEFDEPALGTISGGKLYFFSNSPWKAYNRNFDLDETQFENPTLYTNSLTD
ncbi:TPR end-of-group domain-containing protein [Flavobacterium sp.]|uniref:TPR end-of-group domain-containing protein n=1 Tax=Flavobacterium sp. TaxID=239 RepID=UPI003D6BB0EF